MREDPVDHRGLGDERDDPQGAMAGRARQRVDLEDLLQERRPPAGRLGGRESWRGDDQRWRLGGYGLGLPPHPTRLTFGSRRLHTLRRRDGLVINYKRVHRLYVEEGLRLKSRRRRRRKAATLRATRTVPPQPNERLEMDFMHDVLKDGRAIRVFTLVDACTRECVALHEAGGFKGSDVAAFLSAAGAQRGR